MTSLILMLAALYNPEALVAVGARAEAAASNGATPVVILDLDDTLTDSRTRTARILLELSAEPDAPGLDEQARYALSRVTPSQVSYEVSDTLHALGLSDPTLLATAETYWKQRFFTDAYARTDGVIRGAPEYTHWLARHGARLVYLTGRPEETMRDGTVDGLERNGFVAPDGEAAILMMKPHVQDDDLAFKKAAFERIATFGEVVGVFENEPRNINAMHAAFPDAIAVYVDSIHSRKPDVPNPGIAWVKDLSPEL